MNTYQLKQGEGDPKYSVSVKFDFDDELAEFVTVAGENYPKNDYNDDVVIDVDGVRLVADFGTKTLVPVKEGSDLEPLETPCEIRSVDFMFIVEMADYLTARTADEIEDTDSDPDNWMTDEV